MRTNSRPDCDEVAKKVLIDLPPDKAIVEDFCTKANLKIAKSSEWKLEHLGQERPVNRSTRFLDESLYNISSISAAEASNDSASEDLLRSAQRRNRLSSSSSGSGGLKKI